MPRKKIKQEWIPMDMARVIDREIEAMKKEGKRVREPTRVEAWERIADKVAKQLFIKRRVY